jgi:hypothetical protein
MCMISIHVDITSYHKYDATHISYTPLEMETSRNLELRIKRA